MACVQRCLALLQQIQGLGAELRFHKKKGGELVRRCKLVAAYLEEVSRHGPEAETAPLERLSKQLVKAYEVLRSCGAARVYKVITYGSVQDEIANINASISACIGECAVPREVKAHLKRLQKELRSYEALSVEEDDAIPPEALSIQVEDITAVVGTIQKLARDGFFSGAELSAFRDDVLALNQVRREVGIGDEELEGETYLMQIAERLVAAEQAGHSDPPKRFLCPLTHDLMTDPVILSSGIIYERSAIERWLVNHNTCPVTKMSVDPTVRITVWELRSEIGEWTAKQAIADVAGILQLLVRLLWTGSEVVQEEAARELWSLAVKGNKKAVAGVPGSILWSLAMDPENGKAIPEVPGSLQLLVRLLWTGSEVVQEEAARELWSLAVKGNKKAVAGVPGSILWSLAMDPENGKAIAEVPGSLQTLVGLLGSGSEGVQERAVRILWWLARDDGNKKAIATVPGSLRLLVGLLESEGAQEGAVGALAALAEDPENRKAIAEAPGSLQLLVRLLESGGVGVQERALGAIVNTTEKP
eukprot:TRINITY_DN2029_c0_g2_i4.p1 TRINITY_DN2029_c0_g2~~TRINITY_DN2029_c0_g2_i4.p1  ORF type:complete len:532 (+),score=101.51 TRINITY_DN2029_c0_g2_i4:178-1773(+)